MAISNQNVLKFYFRRLNELQTEKIVQGTPSEIWSRIFRADKNFLGKILFPNFTGSEPET